MRIVNKRIVFIVAILLMYLSSCVQNDFIDPIEEENILTITAGLPGENREDSERGEVANKTRIALTGVDLDVKLTWEVGDIIYLVLTQGDNKKDMQIVTLTEDNITKEGKRASFGIRIPDSFSDEPFNLYGVYGAVEFDGDTHNLNLLRSPWSGKTLEEVQEKDILLLRFATENVRKESPDFTVSFKHVGSLFHIRLFNSSDNTLKGITKAELIAASTIHAHQTSQNAVFDPITGLFSGTVFTANSLPFEISSTSLESGKLLHFWGWYPPVAAQNWPALGLKITTLENSYTSINTKPARTSPTSPGRVYHFYACYDGADLRFTNSDLPEGYFIDERDGTIYGTVTIGNQTWMKENLAYLPSVVGPRTSSRTEAYYYVNGYDGTDIAAAKATSNYKTYGVLYNWVAAMNGEESSTANPSGVQGVCPDGWHLPSDEEWTELETHLSRNGYKYDGTTGGGIRSKIAKSLATSSGWGVSTVRGAIGNTDYPTYRNKSGFSALPGGSHSTSGRTFNSTGNYAYWWSSTSYNLENAMRRNFGFNSTDVLQLYSYKSDGRSVRCVRDN